jgi:hypothetical protein
MCNNEWLQGNKLPPTNKMQKSNTAAFRHGLTAETVIDLLEDQEDDREALKAAILEALCRPRETQWFRFFSYEKLS